MLLKMFDEFVEFCISNDLPSNDSCHNEFTLRSLEIRAAIEAAQHSVQRIGCTCPLIDDHTMGINPLCVVHGELANR